jgi:hypothetical protein
MGSLRHAAWFLITLSLALGACSGPAPPPAPATTAAAGEPDPWPQYAARFVEDYFKAEPFFAVQAGRHEFDGQMPDWSADALAAEAARLKKLRAEAQGFDAATLTAEERFEREYLYTVIDSEVFWLERSRAPFVNPAWYLERLDPDVYLNRDYAPPAKRLAGYIGYARSIPKLAAEIRANLRTPMAATYVQRGIDGFGGFADFYRKDVTKVFASVQDPAAQKDLAAADEAAARAMDELKKWLLGERRRQNNDFALGEPLFVEMLKTTERVDVPVARLLEIGRADLERNTQALKEACAQFLPHATLDACVKKMQSDKPQGGALEGARQQLTMLRSFVLEKHVVSVPPDKQAQVAEAPPYARANAAYINVPGPYEQNVAYTYNIAPPDPSWSAKERAEYIPGRSTLLYTSVHEVWPGHFVQFLHSNSNPSKIAALWVGYAFAEGWAHYAEEMMWEEGLGEGNPEQHIGQLCDALLRDVRYLSALGLHTQGMSVAESDRMFRERAFSDPGNARQQAARGTYDPQYLDYTLGKLMIRKLRADWVAKQPAGGDARQHWKDFHDKFLSYGGPPIPLVRQALVGEDGTLF